MFFRLGTWCHDRKWLVVGAWIGVLIFGAVVSGAVGNGFRDEFNLPDVESRTGFDVLDENFGGQGTGIVGTIVFQAEQGVDDPEVEQQMSALFDEVAQIDGVTRVESPYDEGGERQISSEPPNEGTIAYANVEMPDDIDFPQAEAIRDQILEEAPDIEGVDMELGGFIFAEFEEPSSEILGVAFAIVILIVAFGSVLAMGLPIGVALFGIGLGSMIIALLSNLLPVPDFATFLGIDDRPRRRHRLRAADRHPLSRAAPRRPHGARVGGRGPRHGRPVRPVRRHHRRDLAARHAGDGRRLRVRASPSAPPRWSPSPSSPR